MSWSSSEPTLPSGSSWGAAVSKTETGSNYSAAQTARVARDLGNIYYIELSVYYDVGEDHSSFYPSNPTYFVANGEGVSVGRPSRYQTVKRYYTGSSASSPSVRVGESPYSTYIPSSQQAPTVSVPAPSYWTVSYNGNGATGGSTASQTKVSGTALTLRSNGFTRDKYVFVEWNTAADGSGTSYAEGASYTGNAALTLYAIWKKANIPVFANDSGTIRQIEKAYVNVNGVVKEATVYVNVNGTIKELT